MAAKKRRAAKAGPKCKMVATKAGGKKTKRCWGPKGFIKILKTSRAVRKRKKTS